MNIETKKTKRGPRYRARFSVRYTAFNSPWFPRKEDAKEWAATKRVEVIDGVANTGSSIGVDQFVTLWLENHAYARKTFGSARRDEQFLRRYLLPKIGNKKLRCITVADISFIFSDLLRQGKLSPKTINNFLGTTKRMLKDAMVWGYLSSNPAANVQRVKTVQNEVTIYFDEEIGRLLSFAQSFFAEEYQLFVFALNTGCRLGECVALRWGKVDLDGGFAHIDATYEESTKKVVERTKGKRFRRVPLNEDAIAMLREMVLKGEKNLSPFIFHRINYERLTRRRFKWIILKAGLKDAEERGANFHSFRHTFASEFMRRGGSIYELQKILGHSTITQTEKYAHFAPDYLRGATKIVSFSAGEKGQISYLAAKH